MTRGIVQEVDRFITDLSTRYLPFKKYNPETGKLENSWLQLRVSPIQLWDVSYPIEHRDVVHNTIFKGDGEPINAHLKKFVWGARKAMGLQKLELPKEKLPNMPMWQPDHIEVIGIGVKDDYWIEPDGKHVKAKDKSDKAYEGI